ncbi:MAG TPA: AMP-dependent synthetase [Acidimicrobiaceae bacterium]|nr:AMP-dependent synthetase [Actinomycetota bacterium]HAZ33893.1 AMP-dependent synthetase [Acidimicrobiaceae bacterium]
MMVHEPRVHNLTPARDMPKLTALNLPGSPDFVHALQSVWERGDAVFPLDRRLPMAAQRSMLQGFGVATVISEDGEAALSDGEPIEPGDALVIATSGSSGPPKAAVLTHAAVEASARATSERLQVTDDDHWLACLPLAHVGGLSVITRSLITGTTLTVIDGFDADVVSASEATLVSLVTTALQRIDPSLFRAIVLGGARPPVDRPPHCIATYGLTETGSGVVYNGKPLNSVEIEIRDDEVHLRGPMLLRCYRDGTSPLTSDGWLPTGDLGFLRDDGSLHVEGRRGDVINTGGEKVWPDDVERQLIQHPDIHDVAVTGLPDNEWGQIVAAFVVSARPNLSLDEIRAHCRAQLPGYALPKQLELVKAIPRTALGKVRRSELTV